MATARLTDLARWTQDWLTPFKKRLLFKIALASLARTTAPEQFGHIGIAIPQFLSFELLSLAIATLAQPTLSPRLANLPINLRSPLDKVCSCSRPASAKRLSNRQYSLRQARVLLGFHGSFLYSGHSEQGHGINTVRRLDPCRSPLHGRHGNGRGNRCSRDGSSRPGSGPALCYRA